MITVKLNRYSDLQVRTLHKYIIDTYDTFVQDHCHQDCTHCEYHSMCDDLFRVMGYLTQEIEQDYPHAMKNYAHPKKKRKSI